ncbi:MAG TPA: hypothetical protein VLK82_13785 [Candidatus Tectomicrobia bacterium]|nr:hypothetical protein [Candidatus Tectomicrobia bacterium]
MIFRTIVSWSIVSLWFLTLPVWAVEYRLQVTNIDFLVFASYLERSSGGPRGQETMQGLETRLDRMEFSAAAVLPGRELRLLEDPAYGGQIPKRVSFLPATGQQSWTTIVWEANPGERTAFVVRSDMAAWQEVYDIATNATGVLRRLTIGGPSLFGGQTRQVPAVTRDFLANAADHGTYVSWLQKSAKPVGGMYLVIGRRHEVFTTADRVYMLLTLPPEPHTFKVVVGWRDHDDRSDDLNFERMLWRP